MKVHLERFCTEAEALAFVRAVELVNASEVAVCGPRQQEGLRNEKVWAMAIHDGRSLMPDDTCPLCGACDFESDDDDVDDEGFIPVFIGDGIAHRCDNCGESWAEDALLKPIRS
jgi:hypothetical protein